MSESKTTAEPLAARIAHALADRRPPPSSDFAARLERASERAHPSRMTALLAAAVVACAVLLVVITRPAPPSRAVQPELQQPPSAPPPPPLPHDGRFSASQCSNCHDPAPAPPTAHQMSGDFPLIGGHGSAACATCHAAGKSPQRACSSCHTDPHRGAHGTACAACHTPWSWKPK